MRERVNAIRGRRRSSGRPAALTTALRHRANSPVAVYAATAAGNGLAAIASFLAARYPELERVLPEVTLPARDAWLVTHRDLARSAKVRALSEFVRGLL